MPPSDPIVEQPERDEILAAAVQRAASNKDKDQQASAIEAVRKEIGLHTYETAKQILSTIEYAFRTELIPFVEQVIGIVQQANKPVPHQLRQWLQAIQTTCESAPQSLREGIRAYENLTFAAIVAIDGSTVDANKRKEVIAGIRLLLTSHDGVLSYVRSQKTQLRNFLRDCNWPQ